jgi:hypothetical protein
MKIPYLTNVSILALIFIAGTGSLTGAAPGGPKISLRSTFLYPAHGTSTTPSGINKAGVIVGGVYFPKSGVYSGFERSANGLFQLINEPDGDGTFTFASGINSQGQIAGGYETSGILGNTGFIFSGGAYTSYAPTFCVGHPDCQSGVLGINDQGNYAGWWASAGNTSSTDGFAVVNGISYDIAVPGSIYVQAFSISNTNNQVAGFYIDSSNYAHGFLYDPNTQVLTSIDYPGSFESAVYGINKLGWYVGAWLDEKGITHGFANVNNSWVSYDYPGTHTFTQLDAINDSGVAAGDYYDFGSVDHGLVLQVSQ